MTCPKSIRIRTRSWGITPERVREGNWVRSWPSRWIVKDDRRKDEMEKCGGIAPLKSPTLAVNDHLS